MGPLVVLPGHRPLRDRRPSEVPRYPDTTETGMLEGRRKRP